MFLRRLWVAIVFCSSGLVLAGLMTAGSMAAGCAAQPRVDTRSKTHDQNSADRIGRSVAGQRNNALVKGRAGRATDGVGANAAWPTPRGVRSTRATSSRRASSKRNSSASASAGASGKGSTAPAAAPSPTPKSAFTPQNLILLKNHILKKGDRKTYCSMYNNNPHLALSDMDLYLNPDVGQLNINCDPKLSDFHHVVVYDRTANTYYGIKLRFPTKPKKRKLIVEKRHVSNSRGRNASSLQRTHRRAAKKAFLKALLELGLLKRAYPDKTR
jgi:hypothetical protein